jgi:hypothetical protein
MSCPFFTFLLALFWITILLAVGNAFSGFWIIVLIVVAFIVLGMRIENNLKRIE